MIKPSPTSTRPPITGMGGRKIIKEIKTLSLLEQIKVTPLSLWTAQGQLRKQSHNYASRYRNLHSIAKKPISQDAKKRECVPVQWRN